MDALQVAYTPDSDDVFAYYAWEHGKVGLPGRPAAFHRGHIHELNEAASAGRHDVVAVSAAFYPRVADRYRILAAGNTVGRDFGPRLVSRRHTSVGDLKGLRVAAGGHPTTGSALALMYCPGIEIVPMPYDRIADAIARGEIDAGVMIHEEILFSSELGLACVCDLGRAWCDDTGLPLPVGLNAVRRDLGLDLARDIVTTCQRSLRWAFAHREEVYAHAQRFGRGRAREHVESFDGKDTVRLPDDARRALRVMFDRVAAMGLGPRVASFDVVDGEEG